MHIRMSFMTNTQENKMENYHPSPALASDPSSYKY